MKKGIPVILTLILAAIFAVPLHAQPADDGRTFSQTTPEGATLYFEVTDEQAATVAVVSQNRRAPRFDNPPAGRLVIPNMVIHGGTRYIVAEIGDHAFQSCATLTAVVLPPSLRRIGNYAFAACTSLASADLSRLSNLAEIGGSAFAGCTALAGALTLPDRLKSIGGFAFQGCAALTSIRLPEGLETIGSSAFRGCASLHGGITLAPRLTHVGNNAFADCPHLASVAFYGGSQLTMGSPSAPVFAGCTGLATLILGDNVETIPDNAFKGCTGLREVLLPRRLRRIGQSAFCQCSSLAGALVIPNTVASVGGSAFYGCESLTSVQLSSRLVSIEPYTFYQCASLEGVPNLPDGIATIGRAAFKGCAAMAGALQLPAALREIGSEAFAGCAALNGTLVLPAGVTAIGGRAFAGCTGFSSVDFGAENCRTMGAMGQRVFDGCSGIDSLVIRPCVTQLPACAFAGCSALSGTVTIPHGVSAIGANAFSGCTQITGVALPDSLATIGASAFSGCSRLGGTLLLPASVERIGDRAFKGCEDIAALSLAGLPPHIDENTFQGVSTLIPVLVPCKALEAYRSATPWGGFANIQSLHSDNLLNVTVNDEEMGVVRILRPNRCDDSRAAVRAEAFEGFRFVGWADGDETNPRTLQVVCDTLVEAIFDTGYTVAIAAVSSNGNLGLALGSGDYETGDTAELTAVAFAGSLFAGWGDGVKQNPRRVAAKSDCRYVALFETCDARQSLEETAAEPSRIEDAYPLSVENNSIIVTGAKGHRVEVYDDYGRRVATDEKASNRFVFRAKEPGNYLVRIDGGETRRVVVETPADDEQ